VGGQWFRIFALCRDSSSIPMWRQAQAISAFAEKEPMAFEWEDAVASLKSARLVLRSAYLHSAYMIEG
jgi:hypothetical protein